MCQLFQLLQVRLNKKQPGSSSRTSSSSLVECQSLLVRFPELEDHFHALVSALISTEHSTGGQTQTIRELFAAVTPQSQPQNLFSLLLRIFTALLQKSSPQISSAVTAFSGMCILLTDVPNYGYRAKIHPPRRPVSDGRMS